MRELETDPTEEALRLNLRDLYQPPAGKWDEAFRASGFPRRHGRRLALALGRMGFEQLTRRWQVGQQLIRANGVTYNVYGDERGNERPWTFDPIPLALDGAEWAGLERALIQRATLLNAILADLYGPQRLLHEGRFPPELVYANPGFLRAVHGLQPPHGAYLHSYAADLARSPDGQWWVLADRVQAPSGVGYALENRVVSARTIPTVFDQCQVRPLARFFDLQRQGLQSLARAGHHSPRVVLLSPGPLNETYFEHSYLAHHWGFPLVEGDDLTVRDNHLYLKTLSGLQKVDVVMRRTDDSYCDPLELRGESLLGVAGLVEAARLGNVSIANALGTGLLETSAHMAFLPGLCRQMLGEELKLPSVATWWCGQPDVLAFVRANIDGVVIKPTFAGMASNPEFPATMDSAMRGELLARIHSAPASYVAQEQVALSTAPVRTDTGFAPRHVVLRVFAAWDGQSYSVMPGGLTRMSTEANSLVVSMQQGGGSKDTWILDSPSAADLSQRNVPAPVEVSHAPSDLPSRVADNLYWLGRYSERIESTIRLVRALLPSLSGEEDFGRATSLETAMQFMAAFQLLDQEDLTKPLGQRRWQVERVLSSLIHDRARASSVRTTIENLRRAAWPLKERLSGDTWRVLQQLESDLSVPPPMLADKRKEALAQLLDRAVLSLSAFSGLLHENTTRGYGWRFLDIGKRLERALSLIDLLQAVFGPEWSDRESAIETLLQIADSSITYRTRYLTNLRAEYALELLLVDPANPRSLRFQLSTLQGHILSLPGYGHPSYEQDEPPPAQQITGRLMESIDAATPSQLAFMDTGGSLAELQALLLSVKGQLFDLSNAITERHFSHLALQRLTATF